MELLKLAWKNLWRNRRRTLITLAALSFGLMLIQGSHNLSSGVYRQMVDSGVRAGSGHLVVCRSDYLNERDERLSFATQDLVARISAQPGVEAVLPRLYLPGLAQSSRESRGVLLMGVEPQREKAVNPFLRHLPDDQWLLSTDGHEAVIGDALMKELKLKPGNKFVVTLQHRNGQLTSAMFRIHGVVHTGLKNIDRSLLMVGRERAAQLAGMAAQIHELGIILARPELQPQLEHFVRAQLASDSDTAVFPWQQAMPNLFNAIRFDAASSNFFFIILLLIVTIGVVNTLLMSVMERFREFGVILALGAGPGRLRLLIFLEALLLGLLSLIVGSLLGALLSWYFIAEGIDLRYFIDETIEFGGVVFEPIMYGRWDLWWMLKISFYLLLLTLLAAIYPAFRAGKCRPAEAMRYN